MKKYYCIRYDEGHSNKPCPRQCNTCKGWIAKHELNDMKKKKNQADGG